MLKKLLLFMFVCLVIVSSTHQVMADDLPASMDILEVSINSDTNMMTVTGRITNPAADQQVTMLVYPKGSDYDQTSNILYIDQRKVDLDSNNAFSMSFILEPDLHEEIITVRMGGANIQIPDTFDFYFTEDTPVLIVMPNRTVIFTDSAYSIDYLLSFGDEKIVSLLSKSSDSYSFKDASGMYRAMDGTMLTEEQIANIPDLMYYSVDGSQYTIRKGGGK